MTTRQIKALICDRCDASVELTDEKPEASHGWGHVTVKEINGPFRVGTFQGTAVPDDVCPRCVRGLAFVSCRAGVRRIRLSSAHAGERARQEAP